MNLITTSETSDQLITTRSAIKPDSTLLIFAIASYYVQFAP